MKMFTGAEARADNSSAKGGFSLSKPRFLAAPQLDSRLAILAYSGPAFKGP
jgi:hypothetical protein